VSCSQTFLKHSHPLQWPSPHTQGTGEVAPWNALTPTSGHLIFMTPLDPPDRIGSFSNPSCSSGMFLAAVLSCLEDLTLVWECRGATNLHFFCGWGYDLAKGPLIFSTKNWFFNIIKSTLNSCWCHKNLPQTQWFKPHISTILQFWWSDSHLACGLPSFWRLCSLPLQPPEATAFFALCAPLPSSLALTAWLPLSSLTYFPHIKSLW
jgi:hypothetical protein